MAKAPKKCLSTQTLGLFVALDFAKLSSIWFVKTFPFAYFSVAQFCSCRRRGAMEHGWGSQIEWQLRFGLIRSTGHCQTEEEGPSHPPIRPIRSKKIVSLSPSLLPWYDWTHCVPREIVQRVRLWFVVLFSPVFVRLQPFICLLSSIFAPTAAAC